MNLQEISDGLLDNLLINSIFYLIVDEEFTIAAIPDILTNECYKDLVVNIDGDNFLFRVEDVNILKIHEKGITLDSNLYKILELKNELKREVYKHIFENYLDRIIALLFVNQIVIQNAPLNKIINTPEIIKCLKLNSSLLTSHKNCIISIEPELATQIINCNPLGKANENDGLDNVVFNEQPKISAKELKSFLIHEKKEEIEKIVKEHFSDLRGKGLRFLIEYFVEKKILTLEDKKGLRESFIQLFDGADVAHFNSIFGAKVFSSGDQFYKNKKEVFDEIFNTVFQQSKENPQ